MVVDRDSDLVLIICLELSLIEIVNVFMFNVSVKIIIFNIIILEKLVKGWISRVSV